MRSLVAQTFFLRMLSVMVFCGVVLASAVFTSVAYAQTATNTYSDGELYSLVQTIDNAMGEQQFPELRSEADIAALSAKDRELLIIDLLDIQANLDLTATMDGFSAPSQCFDYYTFGSVNAPIYSDTSNPAAGTAVEFTVNLTNNNPYPVVDANVYVKLFRERPAGEESAQLAHLVDQFQAIQGVSIPANATKEHTFTYDIPAALPSGEYKVATFVSTAERYNLLGLPFTDDVVGDSTTLTIAGDQTGMVRWNRDQVLVDQKQHYFASFIPEVSPTEPVRVTAPIYNELDTPIDGQLTWKVYHWDQQNQANLIDTTTRPISIAAGDTIPATFTLENTDHAAYVVVGEVEYEGTTSLINVRFARTDIAEIRLNYPGVLSYPLVEGEENTLFSCLHSASSFDLVPDSRLDLTLLDAKGNELHSYTYEGPVSSAMMGVADTFIPQQSYDTFTLNAALYQNDTLVEEVSFSYDCAELTDGPCSDTASSGGNTVFLGFGQAGSSGLVLVGIFAILVLIIGAVWFKISKRRIAEDYTTLPSLLLLGVLSTAILMPGVAEAVTNTKEAQARSGLSITAADTYAGQLSREKMHGTLGQRVNNALTAPHATVHYHADIFNETRQNMVMPGDTITVGDVLRLEPRLGDVTWNGTGQWSDTPVGVWYENAAFPQSVLSQFRTRTSGYGAGSYYSYYGSVPEPKFRVNSSVSVPFAVDPPETSVVVSGTANLNPLGGNRYEIVDGGTVQVTYTFDQTYGYYYFAKIQTTNEAIYAGMEPMRTQTPNTSYAATFGERRLIVDFEARPTPPAVNEAPLPPVITGSASGIPNVTYDFSVEGTDPDGDGVFYEVDWTGDEVANYVSTEVSSGNAITISRNWSSLGPKTFYARTVDEYGVRSAWAAHTITINNPTALTVLLEVQDRFGNWTASDAQFPPEDDEITLRWSSLQATDCSANGFAMTGVTPSDRINGLQTISAPAAGNDIQLTVTCTDDTDTVADSLNVTRTDYQIPEVTVSSQVNGGPFTTSDKVVLPGDDITLRWTSTNADECSGAQIPDEAAPSGENAISSPSPGAYIDYSVSCSNSDGGVAIDVIRVTSLSAPTLLFESTINNANRSDLATRYITGSPNIDLHWETTDADSCQGTGFLTGGAVQSAAGGVPVTVSDSSQVTYTIECGNAAGTVVRDITFVAALPDLIPENLNIRTSTEDDPTLFSTTTGNYDYVTVTFVGANRGDLATPDLDPQYSIVFDAGSNNITELDSVYSLGGDIPQNEGVAIERQINDVPFGTSSIRIHLNPNDAISEKDLSNNIATISTIVPPPDPELSLQTEREIVQRGETTRLLWDVGAAYPMNCSVFWQGNEYTFDPSVDGATGEILPTDPINSATTFQISCTEPTTNTTFTETARVEVVGSQMEV